MRTAGLVAVAAALATGVAGFLLGTTVAEPPSPAEPRAAAAASSPGEPRNSGDARRDDRAGRAASANDPLDVVLRRAAAAAEADLAVPAGTGTVRGSVRTAAGAPVAGARVVVSAVADWAEEESGPEDRAALLESALRHVIRGHRWEDLTRRETATGPDGRFEVADLRGSAWTVEASHPAHRVGRARDAGAESDEDSDAPDGFARFLGDNAPVRDGADVAFVAEPRSGLRLDVRMPDGSAPRWARVELSAADGSSGSYWRPEEPVVDAEPGPCTMTVTAGEHDEFGVPATRVDVPREALADVTVTLRALPGILARLHVPKDLRWLPVDRSLLPEGADPEAPRSDDDREAWPIFDGQWSGPRDTEMKAVGIPPGRYVVRASFDGRRVAAVPVEVTDGLREVDVDVPRPAPSSLVEVRLRTADGASPADADFSWRRRSNVAEARYEAPRRRGADGAWTVLAPGPATPQRSSSREPGREAPESVAWTLEVSVRDQPDGRAPWREGTPRLDVVLPAAAWIEAAVEGLPAGTPAGSFAVRVEPGGERADVGPEGTARLGPFVPGTRRLSLLTATRGGDLRIAEADVEAVAGTTRAAFRLPPLHPVSVDLGEPRARSWVLLRRAGLAEGDDDDDTSVWITLDDRGRGSAPRVPAGAYELVVDEVPHAVQVPSAGVFRLE